MILALLIGVFGTQYVLEHTNVAKFELIEKMEVKVREIKHKKIIEYGSMLIISAVLWMVLSLMKVSGIFQGVIVGVIWGLIMFIFEDTIFDNARNTLR